MAEAINRVAKAEGSASEAVEEQRKALAIAEAEVKALRHERDAFEADIAKRASEVTSLRTKLAGL